MTPGREPSLVTLLAVAVARAERAEAAAASNLVHPQCARHAGQICTSCRPHFGYAHPGGHR